MINNRPKAFKPAFENYTLKKAELLDEIKALNNKIEKEKDPNEKVKLQEQLKHSELMLGAISGKILKG
jgi:hypothetical protein